MSASLERVPVIAPCSLRVGVDGEFVLIHDEPITPGRRQLALQRVAQDDGEDLVVARDARQVRLRRATNAEKVAEYDDQAAGPRDPPERRHRQRERRFAIVHVCVFVPLPVGMLG